MKKEFSDINEDTGIHQIMEDLVMPCSLGVEYDFNKGK
jgi:hypothetical protein